MALYTGLQLPESNQKLAGIVVMSGYLPGANSFKLTAGLESTPVYHFHGSSDPVVKHEWADKTKNGLQALGVSKYALKSYNGVGHTISMDILYDVKAVIASLLPNDPAFIVKVSDNIS